MKKLLITISILIITNLVAAQKQDQSPPPVTIENLKENIYLVRCGWASSITLLVGNEELLMVDSNLKENIAVIYDEIREKFNGKTIKYIINTHHHPDHTGGNPFLLEKGVVSIAHENTKTNMHQVYYGYNGNKRILDPSKGKQNKDFEKEETPPITFSKKMNLHFSEEKIELIHAPNAHTDGDAIIYFKQNNVIALGDLYFGNTYSGGINVAGMIEAYEKVLAMINEETIIIPGHAAPSSKSDLSSYLKVIKEIWHSVSMARKQGKTLDEVKEDNLITAKYDQAYENQWISGQSIRKMIYKQMEEMENDKPK